MGPLHCAMMLCSMKYLYCICNAHVPFPLALLLRAWRHGLTQLVCIMGLRIVQEHLPLSWHPLQPHVYTLLSLSDPPPFYLSTPSIITSHAPALTLTDWRTDEEDGEDESGASRGGVHDNLYRVHMPSLYSCGSSYGSEASLPATAHTVSNAPVTEYMWVSTHC